MQFATVDIWRIRLKGLPATRALPIKYARIFLAAFNAFAEHRCQLRASALTFFSLLSVVPVVAMAFGIAKGFALQKLLEQRLLGEFPGQEEVLLKVFEFANAFLENTKGGLIAGVGVIVLFWTIIKVLGNIEDSFNDIWGVVKARTLARKATDYLSIMLTAPVLLILSSSVTVFITTQVEFIAGKLELLGALRPLITFALKAAPYTIMWVLFAFVYVFIPNTKTHIPSCIFAGIVGGTIYQAVQWFYVKFQVGVAQYNAIYGSFAALPLFLVWLQLSWLIVLAGAEIAYAHQTADTHEFRPDALRASAAFRRLLSLRVAGLLCRRFASSPEPLTLPAILGATEMPEILLRTILDDLRDAGIVSVVASPVGREPGYQPALDTSLLTVKYVLDALEQQGVSDIPVARTPELEALSKSLSIFGALVETSPANKLLKDI
jgi:membrane protein